MKKLLLLSILVGGLTFGQSFKITPNNFVNVMDETKDYLVIEVPNLTQKELFQKTKMFIQSNFKNLKGDGYNEVEYSQIKLREVSPIDTGRKLLGNHIFWNGTNTIEINFKDGKLMIKPHFEYIENGDKNDTKIYLQTGALMIRPIFKKDGKVSNEGLYNGINADINETIENLKTALTKEDNW